ncbi:sugar phosphate isomerase/epimerase [Candidatus Poribacteria bacterium]|nr:sugar phosphate isomerase/epimerase [Candidatus Poribacteria bacterium]
MKIGFHTDAFTSVFWDIEKCLQWAKRNDVHYMECGVIDGVSWAHGLRYYPHIALWEDPLEMRRLLDKYDVQFANLDAAYPLSAREARTVAIPYVLNTVRYAKLIGCPNVDTTDGLFQRPDLSDSEALAYMKENYAEIMRIADAYEVNITIEPHGYYTTKPDFMAEMLDFVDSPFLKMNMDTGNTYIAGQDPVAFLRRFLPKVSHCHVKDVSAELAEAVRGKESGIAISYCAIGDGVNADNIRTCVSMLAQAGYDGVLCLESEGMGGPMLEKGLAWVRQVVADATSS